ncbi:MAG: hypothetical protein CMN44_00260 [SAR116 cluster bacterium]|nr:hypothetical protein [SAR116 cluster bacterium]RPH12257.1 MAG: DUF4115 domain-containing protein [Alphaproteobacteria bacterium TMED54]|tara:strand:- start:1708 stop:2700 length:993 start_codon:yes stop_codon:yes gene_type:complete
MHINDKKSKNLTDSTFDDRNISKDFSEIFDSNQKDDLSLLFIDARVKKGLTQEQVSKILKVKVSSIQKVEVGEELDDMGTAYQMGFLRSYAKLLDLDTNVVIDTYKAISNKNVDKVDYNFPSITKQKKSFFPAISLASLTLALVIYSSWYYLNIDNLKNNNVQISESKIDDYDLNYVKIKIEDQEFKIENEDKIKNDIAEISNNQIQDPIVENMKESKTTNQKSINLVKPEDTNEISAIATERVPEEEMVLKSFGNSWVEIEDLDGNAYLTRLMRNGETFVVPKKKGLTLSTGNAGVLSLTFGSISVSRLGGVGEVITSRPLNIEAFQSR